MNNVFFTKAYFYRNLKDYKFVPKLTKEKQNEIIEKVSQILTNFKLVSANAIDEKTVKILNKNSLKISNKSLLLDEKNGIVIGSLHLLFGIVSESCFLRTGTFRRRQL